MSTQTRDWRLRTGLFLGPFHPNTMDPTLGFARDLALIQHLDELGFEEAWIGEHHSGGFEQIAAPELMVAAAAERTKHIRLGTGVKSLPYYHPFIVADMMAQLDHMTRGRAMFGVGPGALPSDAHMLGLGAEDLRPRMTEALDAIVPLLRGEVITRKTDWYNLVEARLSPGCFTKPMLEMAVTNVFSPAGAIEAGKYGLGILTLGGIDDASLTRHAANWAIYEEECARHGHVADRSKWRVTCLIHIAETREQALEQVRFGFEPYAAYTGAVVPTPAPLPRGLADPGQWLRDNQRAIVGSPQDAIDEIRRIHSKIGDFGAILNMGHDWANWQNTRRSYELIAEWVKPAVNGSNRARQASYDWAESKHVAHLEAAQRATAKATENAQASKTMRAAE
jgi:limonene 1,2-monooxygenase